MAWGMPILNLSASGLKRMDLMIIWYVAQIWLKQRITFNYLISETLSSRLTPIAMFTDLRWPICTVVITAGSPHTPHLHLTPLHPVAHKNPKICSQIHFTFKTLSRFMAEKATDRRKVWGRRGLEKGLGRVAELSHFLWRR